MGHPLPKSNQRSKGPEQSHLIGATQLGQTSHNETHQTCGDHVGQTFPQKLHPPNAQTRTGLKCSNINIWAGSSSQINPLDWPNWLEQLNHNHHYWDGQHAWSDLKRHDIHTDNHLKCSLGLLLRLFLFALLYADTLDCLLSSIPHPITGPLYFYDLISLTRSHLAASCPVRYDLPCTIRIYEPPIRLLVALVKFRFPST